MGVFAIEKAHAEGDAARYYDEPISANPYTSGTPEYAWWVVGWMERDDELDEDDDK